MKQQVTCPLLLSIFLLTILHAGAQKQPAQGYTISGTIKGIATGTVKLVRNNQEDRTSTPVDSTRLQNGRFTLKGSVTSPEVMTLEITPGNWAMQLFVENSNIAVIADTTGSQYYDYTAYGYGKGAQLKNYTVSGSANQDFWMQYEKAPALKVYEPAFAKLNKAYAAAAGNKDKAYQIKEEMDSLRNLLTVLQKAWIDSFISVHPSSAAGAYFLNYYYMFNSDLPLPEMEAMMGKLSGPATATVYYATLSKALAKRKALQPGKLAPDFTLLKPDSTLFTLSSLKGKYVLLDFWASWCVPCRKAIPHWKEVYQEYHPKGLEMVSITDDIKWSDWFKALDAEKMPWLQVADEFPVKNMPSRVGQLYMVPYLPTYILLDREGKIILHNGSEEQIGEKLKELLGG